MPSAPRRPAPATPAKKAAAKLTKAAGTPAKSAAKAAPAKATKPAAKAAPKAVAKPAAKAVAPKPAAKPAAKVSAKPALKKAAPAKAPAKAATKPAAKSAPVKAAKPAAKPAKAAAPAKPAAPAKAVKPAPKSATPAKPAAAKPVAKPAPAARSRVADPKPAKAPAPAASALTPKPGVIPRVAPKRENTMSEAPKKPVTGRFESVAVEGGKPVITASMGFTSPFTAEELAKWRSRLMQQRHQVTDDIADLEKDAMEAEDGHTTPLHAAERGSDADLQDVSLALAGQEKDLLWQIDRALRKIDVGRPIPYGLCEHTREPINKARLEAIPWTPLSIEGATHLEENGLTVEDLLLDD